MLIGCQVVFHTFQDVSLSHLSLFAAHFVPLPEATQEEEEEEEERQRPGPWPARTKREREGGKKRWRGKKRKEVR